MLKTTTEYNCKGSVLLNDIWNPKPASPPPINFEHDQISIYLALFRVRLG